MGIGDKAPDFELPSTEGKKVRLQDELGKGNILLLFYPFAFSSVCTAEMCSIRDGMTEFTAVKAKVFGISVDSPYAQKAWVQQLNLNFPLLSDFNKEVSKAYSLDSGHLVTHNLILHRRVICDNQNPSCKIYSTEITLSPSHTPCRLQLQNARNLPLFLSITSKVTWGLTLPPVKSARVK